MRKSASAVLLPLLLASAAAPANDACLVGGWEPQGNAFAEWMQRRNPGLQMQVQQDSARFEFRADGTYSADMRGSATARGSDGMAAKAGGRFGGSGRWTTSGDTLTLHQGVDRTEADLELSRSGATVARSRLPAGAGGPLTYGYRCEGNRLELRMTMPGSGDVVVQPFLRERR